MQKLDRKIKFVTQILLM